MRQQRAKPTDPCTTISTVTPLPLHQQTADTSQCGCYDTTTALRLSSQSGFQWLELQFQTVQVARCALQNRYSNLKRFEHLLLSGGHCSPPLPQRATIWRVGRRLAGMTMTITLSKKIWVYHTC